MTFEVEIAGRTRTVAVERAGAGRYRVSVDGEIHLVDAVRSGDFGLSLILEGGNAASREVVLVPEGGNGALLASIEGRTIRAVVNGRRSRRLAGDRAGAGDGEQAIVAPMPGRVVRVLVSPGDEVAARQAVVVVEAMKMENELRAPRAGRIKEVAVTPGTSVEAGRVLAIIG